MIVDVIYSKREKIYWVRFDNVPFISTDRIDEATELKAQFTNFFLKHEKQTKLKYKDFIIDKLTKADLIVAASYVKGL